MPRYEWTRDEPFRDNRNDRRVEQGEIVELPENVAEPAYGFVEAEESESDSEPETSEADTDAETETFRCGVEKSDGEPCSREVESESATCWQH